MFVQTYFLGYRLCKGPIDFAAVYCEDARTWKAHRRKSEGKRKLWKTEMGPVHKSDGEREINGIRQESETKHGVPYAFASAAGGRAGGNIRTATEHNAVHAQPPGRAHLVCFCSSEGGGGGGGGGSVRKIVINAALRVRASRLHQGMVIRKRSDVRI